MDLLPELLARRAREAPHRRAFTASEEPTRLGELGAAVFAFAGALERRGVARGDRVVLALPNGRDFLVAFHGLLAAGAVAVPLSPESSGARLAAFAARAGARRMVVPPERVASLLAAPRQADDAPPLQVLASDLRARPRRPLPTLDGDDLALVQYTSGSTGEPKGVAIAHRDLMINLAQMIAGFAITPDDVFVSWLPVHHDMGLILMTLAPLVVGARFHLYPTGLAGIRGWLPALSRQRATFTAAPDFAYRLALRLAGQPMSRRDAQPDLSCLRVALDAAEPVRASTVHAFEEAHGLERVVLPGYGLAEATVGVTAPPPGSALSVDARGHVGLGRGFPGVQLAIAASDGHCLPAGEVGEVWVRSPARARGYLDDPEATAVAFRSDGWLATGDLGYLDADGELYVVGREKDLLSLGGATVAPRELEELVDRLPFVRRSAAVGIESAGREGELPYLFVEARPRAGDDPADQVRQVAATVRHHLGVAPGRVYLVRPGTLPLTANGKLQRTELARAYRDGTLLATGAMVFPRY